MRKSHGRGFLAALAVPLLLAVACGSDSPSSPPIAATPVPTPAPARVVIVSVDGLRPDALLKTPSLNIGALIARGASTMQARTISLSNTLPSHVSMLSGYLLDVHKVNWDDYQAARKIQVPTLFTAVRAAGKRSVLIAGKEKFNHFRDTGFVDTFVVATGGDDDVANQAVVQLVTPPDLMFVHFPDVDLSGHAATWMSAGYLERVTTADKAIGRIVGALPAGATLILTADHGGRPPGHGTTAAEDVTIPWIMAGPGVKRGYTIAGRVSTVDTAATVARILGLSLQPDVAGRPVAEAFE